MPGWWNSEKALRTQFCEQDPGACPLDQRISTSASSPAAPEKRTPRILSVRTMRGQVRAAYGLSFPRTVLQGTSVNKGVVLHSFYPLRSPLRRFEGFGKIRPRPLDLAFLKVDYLAGIDAVAIILEGRLHDAEVLA